uniref:Uncharacterized protein n=1 Tax=uncultured bacterium Contig1757 TaxID=1393500 RepID=W0FQL4_9BACT|nr:hypothetical protein [uncultured bacterium Contig1757]
MNISWKPEHSMILLLVVLFAVALGFNAIMLGDRFGSGMTSAVLTEVVILIVLSVLLSIPVILGFKKGSKSLILFFSAGFLIIMFVAVFIGISELENIDMEKRMQKRDVPPVETHNKAIDEVISELDS